MNSRVGQIYCPECFVEEREAIPACVSIIQHDERPGSIRMNGYCVAAQGHTSNGRRRLANIPDACAGCQEGDKDSRRISCAFYGTTHRCSTMDMRKLLSATYAFASAIISSQFRPYADTGSASADTI